MPKRRFDSHEHILEIRGEYLSAGEAVNRLKTEVERTPDLLEKDSPARKHLPAAYKNLEGTYIVRLFAAFESALRSFDRAHHQDPSRKIDVATMIDQIGGKRVRRMQESVRKRAHDVREVRNYWAHESDVNPGPMTIDRAKSYLQRYLSLLPEDW